jgi:hypothetical protein
MGLKKGQNLLEFAIIIPVVIIMILGVVDFGRAMLTYSALNTVVREATRDAVVQPPSAFTYTKAQVSRYPFLKDCEEKCTICINDDPNCTLPLVPAGKVRVFIRYIFTPITPFLNFFNWRMDVQSEMLLTPYAK